MPQGSQSFERAKNAIEEYFPSICLPAYRSDTSVFDLIEVLTPLPQSITSQTIRPHNSNSAIQRMKMASDSQEYRIQKSYLEMDKENRMMPLD